MFSQSTIWVPAHFHIVIVRKPKQNMIHAEDEEISVEDQANSGKKIKAVDKNYKDSSSWSAKSFIIIRQKETVNAS